MRMLRDSMCEMKRSDIACCRCSSRTILALATIRITLGVMAVALPIRIEADLVDQLFNSSEKRLARALLLLARYGKHDKPVRAVSPITQETLAEMVGTTRSRVNFFMKKFQRLGFIDYRNGLKVNHSLLTVVLHD